jgi:uncharacterized protein YeeX (DUF496 family)
MRDDKGRFAEGNEGRPKGSVNKSINEIREAFQMLLEDNLEKLQEDLNELAPKDRIKLLLDLSNYILPKLRTTEYKGEAQNITIDFSEDISFEEK